MAELQKMLWAAERPIVILGGGGWSERAGAALQRFAERFDLPVATSFRRATLFDGGHQNYAGEIGIGPNPKLKARIEARRSRPAAWRAHVGNVVAELYAVRRSRRRARSSSMSMPTPQEIGRIYHPSLGIVATPPAFCAALEGLAAAQRDRLERGRPAQARADYLAWTRQRARHARPRAARRDHALAARTHAPDAIIANGAGNYATWPGRFLRYRRFDSADRADLRLDGLWRAGGGRRQARCCPSGW